MQEIMGGLPTCSLFPLRKWLPFRRCWAGFLNLRISANKALYFSHYFFELVNKFYAFLNFWTRVNESRALEFNLLIIICGDSSAWHSSTVAESLGVWGSGGVACIVVIIL